MSTRDIEDDFGDPDRNPCSGWFARTAHVVLPVMVIVLVVRTVYAFTNLPIWLMITTAAASTLVVVASAMHIHLARICLRCMEAVPADAPLRAQRRKPALWLEHKSRQNTMALSILGFILLSPWVLGGLLYWDLPAGDVHDNWISLPGDLLLTFWIYSSVLHHRLQPWCPWCKGWDEGGEHEHTPVPDPTGVKTG